MNRVLFFSHNLNLEGAPLSLFRLVCTLSQEGYDVAVAAPGKGPLYEKYVDADIPVHLPKKRIKRNLSGKDFITFVIHTAKTFQPKVIFVNSLILYKVVETLLKESKSKVHVNWIIHESEKEAYSEEYTGMDLSLLSKTYSTIFVSEATKYIYREYDKNNFKVIHNGLDIKSIEQFQKQVRKDDLYKKLNVDTSKTNIIFPGTTCLRKGQIDMIRALAYYKDYLASEKYHIYIVGGRWSEYLNDMKYLVTLFNIEQYITIVPETDTIYDYYSVCNLFINFSYIESLPITVLEAMAFKLPIIASNVYGIPEMVTHDREAILVNPGDEIQLIFALNDLLSNDNKANLLAKNAHKKVLEHFSIESMVKKYVKICE